MNSGFETVFDKIPRGHVLKQLVVHHSNRIGPETDLSLTHATRHLLLQFFKRALTTKRMWRV